MLLFQGLAHVIRKGEIHEHVQSSWLQCGIYLQYCQKRFYNFLCKCRHVLLSSYILQNICVALDFTHKKTYMKIDIYVINYRYIL